MPLFEVTTPTLVRQFLDLPARLYQNQPNWISPLDPEIEAVFDPAKNTLLAHGEAIRWVLTNAAGTVVGRVAAFINHDAEPADPTLPVGGMGFFECEDNQESANKLFAAARQWLAARGQQAMDGPINFGERDRFWGLLTDGFTEPNYGMFFHQPYYKRLFELYGFELFFRQYTCYREVDMPLHPAFSRAFDKYAQQYPTFRFEHANKRHAEKLAHDFHHVYNLAWANHSGISPMSLAKARDLVKQMQPVLDERLLWFAYHHDEPIAFFVSLPELNQLFKQVSPRFGVLAKLRFLWEKRQYQLRRDKKLFGVIFGVVPEWQGQGIESALMVHARAEFMRAGYREIEMNWIGDFNPRMLAVTRSIGARIYKTHVTYRYLFDRERPFERSPIIR